MDNTITITFGDQAENHVGMQKIGELSKDGFNLSELNNAKKIFEEKGYICELINLNNYLPVDIIPTGCTSRGGDIKTENAYILIIRNGVDLLLNTNDLYKEQNNLDVDKKAFMYGRVVNKHARYNLCFSEENQEPDYINKKGRLISFKDVPLTNKIRLELDKYFGDKAKLLQAEGNYYYDIKKCGIGFHGDSERKKVIAIRLGKEFPLHYQWFTKNKSIGKRVELNIKHGDIYVMSEKATGYDWKKKNSITLRHAAGCEKFLKINK